MNVSNDFGSNADTRQIVRINKMKRHILEETGFAPVYDRNRISSREKGSRNDRRRLQNTDERNRIKGRLKDADEGDKLSGLKGNALLAAVRDRFDDAELDAGCAVS